MKIRDLLRDRDLTIEAQFLNTLSGMPAEQRELARTRIRQAIQRASELWESKYLPILVGGEGAARSTLDTQAPHPNG